MTVNQWNLIVGAHLLMLLLDDLTLCASPHHPHSMLTPNPHASPIGGDPHPAMIKAGQDGIAI